MDEKTIARFWAKVDKSAGTDGCWLWLGCMQATGYGRYRRREGTTDYAHRVAMEMAGHDITGLVVCHRCDNPSCVNHAHLFLGTHADNVSDKVSKGRHRYGERVPNSAITADQVREIRAAAAGGATQTSIAERYPVNRRTIGCIVRRITWRSVA